MLTRWRALKSRAAAFLASPLQLRLRLTLFYGLLSIISGAILLFLTYALVAHFQSSDSVAVEVRRSAVLVGPRAPDPLVPPRGLSVPVVHQPHQSGADLIKLLILAAAALAIMALISVGVGWLIAGRVLRPVRTMTLTLRQISARNLHERLAVTGHRNELKDLADTIDGLLGRLETALDGHKRFVANAAHELRTPLTVEHALLEEPLIDREVTVESFRSNFERLLAISEQRGRLLESLLTLSSSEHGREHYEPLDLGAITDEVLRTNAPERERYDVLADAMITPVEVLGDPALIQRLVANLLDNAVQHNVPGGWVEIGTRAQAGQVVLFVANSGPNVPAAQVDRLIEPFQRLHRVAHDDHHGLGLSIVHAIAIAHDATLSVQARMSGGLSVQVAFPALDPAHALAQTPALATSNPL